MRTVAIPGENEAQKAVISNNTIGSANPVVGDREVYENFGAIP